MLPGLITNYISRDPDDTGSTPTTPRKRLLNFKIPLTNRSSQRRDTVMAAQRRLYKDDRDGEHRRFDRKRRSRKNGKYTEMYTRTKIYQ